jgi:hypothetical protein
LRDNPGSDPSLRLLSDNGETIFPAFLLKVHLDSLSRIIFLVRDGLYSIAPCVSVCESVLRFHNSQRNLYRLKPVLLLISSTVQTACQVHCKCTVYRGWNKQPYTCSKESVCSPVPRMCMRFPDSCSICHACFRQSTISEGNMSMK